MESLLLFIFTILWICRVFFFCSCSPTRAYTRGLPCCLSYPLLLSMQVFFCCCNKTPRARQFIEEECVWAYGSREEKVHHGWEAKQRVVGKRDQHKISQHKVLSTKEIYLSQMDKGQGIRDKTGDRGWRREKEEDWRGRGICLWMERRQT